MSRSTAIVACIGCLIISGCFSAGRASFPEASPGFQPPGEYDVSFDTAWEAVQTVLDSERIMVESTDRNAGRIVTQYVQGETQVKALGLLGVLSTRYRYEIRLTKKGSGKVGIRVAAFLESSSSNLQWHDVSADNPQIVRNLENSLLEKIDHQLKQKQQ